MWYAIIGLSLEIIGGLLIWTNHIKKHIIKYETKIKNFLNNPALDFSNIRIQIKKKLIGFAIIVIYIAGWLFIGDKLVIPVWRFSVQLDFYLFSLHREYPNELRLATLLFIIIILLLYTFIVTVAIKETGPDKVVLGCLVLPSYIVLITAIYFPIIGIPILAFFIFSYICGILVEITIFLVVRGIYGLILVARKTIELDQRLGINNLFAIAGLVIFFSGGILQIIGAVK